MQATGVDLCQDEDLLRYEPNLDEHWPRKDRQGNVKRDWRTQRGLAAEKIQRLFRARRNTAEQFQLGRMSQRTLDELRPAAAYFSLHFIYVAADTQGDSDGFFARKAAFYARMAIEVFEEVALAVDYDADNDGTHDKIEEQMPMGNRFIRG